MYCQRIQTTAKLTGIKGSSIKRQQLAETFYFRFKNMFDYKISQKGSISAAEIKGFVKHLAPDINFSISDMPKEFNYAGALQSNLSVLDGTFEGHSLLYDFLNTRKIITREDKRAQKIIKHEIRHLCTNITEPKYVIKLLAKTISSEESKESYKFYREVLYKKELNEKNFLCRIPTIKMFIIKNKINNFLEKNKFTPEQKLEILTGWRYRLKTEQIAYQTDPETYTESRYLFSKKIKLVERMILDEMLDAGHDALLFSQKK